MVVADTSPLVFLARLGHLELAAALLAGIHVPEAVVSEATVDLRLPGARAVQEAVRRGLVVVRAVDDEATVATLARVVDPGEAAAMALALQLEVRGLLMDDAAGRKLAKARGLLPVGTLGLLVAAVREGLLPALGPELDALERAGFRMSEELKRHLESVR